MQKILVSIIVPVYNVVGYMDECVMSILSQRYDNLQIILVDDGSTDGCGELCDTYASKDSRIEVVHKKNGGLSSARNEGLRYVRGEYVAFVDSDDAISENYVCNMLTVAQAENADMVVCDMIKGCKFDNALFYKSKDMPQCFTHAQLYTSFYKEVKSVMITVAWNKLYKSDLIGETRFPDGLNNEDMWFSPVIEDKAKRIAVMNDKLYFYREREGSIQTCGFNLKKLHIIEAFRFQRRFFKDRDTRLYKLSLCGFINNSIICYNTMMSLGKEQYQEQIEQIRRDLNKYNFFDVFSLPMKWKQRILFLRYLVDRKLNMWH